MIADLLAYLRDGWHITGVHDRMDGRAQWMLVKREYGYGRIATVPLPDGWVKPQ